MAPHFHGLLIVPEEGERTANLPPGESPLDVYLRCAALSARSFRHFGYDWTLVTDRVDLIAERCARMGIDDLALRNETFTLELPAGIPFRLAHYKLELLGKLGTGAFGDAVALVDLDTLCLRELPDGARLHEGLHGYLLGPRDGSEGNAAKLPDSLRLLLGEEFIREWWGGEFLSGEAACFAALWRHIEALWPTYAERWPEMVHAGDEMVVGAALQRFRDSGGFLADAGEKGVIARYWTARTQHRPRAFRDFDDVAILHLPADKDFLAGWAGRPFDPAELHESFHRHVSRKVRYRRLTGLLGRGYAPRYR